MFNNFTNYGYDYNNECHNRTCNNNNGSRDCDDNESDDNNNGCDSDDDKIINNLR